MTIPNLRRFIGNFKSKKDSKAKKISKESINMIWTRAMARDVKTTKGY